MNQKQPLWEIETILKKENFIIFDVGIERKRHSITGKIADFTKVYSPCWVNIIPITTEGKIVLVEQFRQGTDKLTIEIPGGMVEQYEEPSEAGKRECEEETGYYSEQEVILLGVVEPNPAFMNNKCYTYLWKDCQKTKQQNFDELEEIRTFEVSEDELFDMVNHGIIQHSIILNALFYFKLYREKNTL